MLGCRVVVRLSFGWVGAEACEVRSCGAFRVGCVCLSSCGVVGVLGAFLGVVLGLEVVEFAGECGLVGDGVTFWREVGVCGVVWVVGWLAGVSVSIWFLRGSILRGFQGRVCLSVQLWGCRRSGGVSGRRVGS